MSTRIQLTREERAYLTRLLRAFVTGEATPEPIEPIAWDRFHAVLRVNGLTPIFHRSVNGRRIPAPQLKAFREVTLRSAARSCIHTRAAVKLFRMLDDASVPALGLRGVVLSHWVYDDPVLRPMTDIDLLVAKRDAVRIIDALGRHGYMPTAVSRNQLVYAVDGCKVEIHWNLIKRILPRDFEPWIATRRRIPTSYGDLFGLSASHELIALVCHGFIHHDVDTLLKVVDIALLCRKEPIDWAYVRDWSERQSLDRIFGFTLAFVDYLLGTRLRGALALEVSPNPYPTWILESYAARLFGQDRRIDLVRRRVNFFFLAQGPTAKLRLLRRFCRNQDLRNVVTLGFDTRRALQRP